MQARGCTPTLKHRTDVIRSPIQGYQWPHKRTDAFQFLLSSYFFLDKEKEPGSAGVTLRGEPEVSLSHIGDNVTIILIIGGSMVGWVAYPLLGPFVLFILIQFSRKNH